MHIPCFLGKLGGLPVPSPAPSTEPEVDLGCPPSPAPLCCQGYKWISCRLHILPPLPSSCRVTGRAGWSRMAWGGSRGCRPWVGLGRASLGMGTSVGDREPEALPYGPREWMLLSVLGSHGREILRVLTLS